MAKVTVSAFSNITSPEKKKKKRKVKVRLAFLFREGNGTPLQYSCLENAMGTRSERMWSLMLSPDGEVY